MKKLFLLLCFISIVPLKVNAEDGNPSYKTRMIVTSDNEGDDRNSMVRFLLYTNDFDCRGIVYSASKFHSANHNWDGSTQFQEFVKQYGVVYPFLIKHSKTYPTPAFLASRVKIGNLNYDDITTESEGANLIRDELLLPDTTPIWVGCWGGSNTAAAALKQIETKYPARKAEVTKKMKLFLLDIQDGTWDSYIKPKWPGMTVVHNAQSFAIVGYSYGNMPDLQDQYFSQTFMSKIVNNHGPLMAARSMGSGTNFMSEGDNPAWYILIPVGLRQLDNFGWGSWGGRYERPNGTGTYWKDVPDDGNMDKPVWRWAVAVQNDFLARADWCVKEFASANHQPDVKLGHNRDLWAAAGATVNLSAAGTTDPDNNALTYNWWVYKDPSSFKGTVTINTATAQTASFTMPSTITTGQTIHVICEVTDKGTPPMTRYDRVVVTCGTAPVVANSVPLQNPAAYVPSLSMSGNAINFTASMAGIIQVSVLRMDGSIVAVTSATAQIGKGSIKLADSVGKGMYVLRVRGCGINKTTAFVMR